MGGKVNVLIAVLLAIVVGVAMLPVVADSVDNYDIKTVQEEFTAVEDDTVEEVIEVEEDIEKINYVEVEGEKLDEADYEETGAKEIELVDDASDTDDEIVVSYDYQMEVSGAVDSLVNLLPILFTVIIVAGAVYYVRFK